MGRLDSEILLWRGRGCALGLILAHSRALKAECMADGLSLAKRVQLKHPEEISVVRLEAIASRLEVIAIR